MPDLSFKLFRLQAPLHAELCAFLDQYHPSLDYNCDPSKLDHLLDFYTDKLPVEMIGV